MVEVIRFALLAALLSACVAPSQHDEARWGTVTVAFGPSVGPGATLVWRADQLTELRAELRALAAYGDATDPAAQYNDVATSVPTELDLAGWRRVHP